jgi:hypothetical protein
MGDKEGILLISTIDENDFPYTKLKKATNEKIFYS